MSDFASCIYTGTVVHKRLTPRQHAFCYRVFALCLDVDEIDRLDRDTRLFSRNRFNLIGFRDRDYAAGDGERVADSVRRLLRGADLGVCAHRVAVLSYPRVLGYVFNPISVYFCRDDKGVLGALVYEVTNTFRERISYVIRVPASGGSGGQVVAQTCAKRLYVSPFTAAVAEYGFHVLPPAERVVVGVDLREGGQPVLKTHFAGERRPFCDRVIAGLLLSQPLLTLKVVGAIHVEAARLWRKGVPVQPHHAAPAYAVSIVGERTREASHA